MLEATLNQLEALASDPTVGALARLQSIALRAAADPVWATGLGDLIAIPPSGQPLLEGKKLVVSGEALRALLRDLASAATQDDGRIGRLLGDGRLDPISLVEASVCQDVARLEALADSSDVEPGFLATLVSLASLPLLLAVGRLAAGRPQFWSSGECPVCGAWPTLAEVTGVERKRTLRCGRCGAGWWMRHGQCVYCGADDHRALGYLAAEATRESRQAVTCERCHGYLKSIAAHAPADPFSLGLLDLTTVELDVAALERGYARPGPARTLDARVLAV
jgi:FdhE protein